MALPAYEQRMLIRNPFGSYAEAYHVPTVAADLFSQVNPAVGTYDVSLVFKNLYDFTRNDSDTLLRADGLTSPVNIVPDTSTFICTVGGQLRTGLGVGDSRSITATPMDGNTVIVDDAGVDVATLGVSQLLSGSMYEKVVIGGLDFTYSMAARSRILPVESDPFRLFYKTVYLPVDTMTVPHVEIASWGGLNKTMGAGSFAETVAPTLHGTAVPGDIYILRIYTQSRAEDTGSGSTTTMTTSVLGTSGTSDSTVLGGFYTLDGDEFTIAVLTSVPWPPGDMSVSGTATGFGGMFITSASLLRIRVDPLHNLGNWASPL